MAGAVDFVVVVEVGLVIKATTECCNNVEKQSQEAPDVVRPSTVDTGRLRILRETRADVVICCMYVMMC